MKITSDIIAILFGMFLLLYILAGTALYKIVYNYIITPILVVIEFIHVIRVMNSEITDEEQFIAKEGYL